MLIPDILDPSQCNFAEKIPKWPIEDIVDISFTGKRVVKKYRPNVSATVNSTPHIKGPLILMMRLQNPVRVFILPIASVVDVHFGIARKVSFIGPQDIANKTWVLVYFN